MKVKQLPLLLAVTSLAACANPYAQFYRSTQDAKSMPSYIPATEPLKIYSTSDFKKDTDALLAKSYFPVGNSSFNAAANKVSDSQVRSQAEKVSASVVLISSRYTHTVQGAMPLTLPHTTTSYSTGSATAYGANGPVTAFGNSTTTTYGTETTMIPYSIQRSDFGAVFFVKVKQRVGMICVPLDDATRKQIGTNSGLLIRIVVEGSTAFQADVFAGDILLGVGAEKVYSQDNYKSILDGHEGQTMTFHLIRDGSLIDKTMRIASYKEAS